MHDMVVPMHVGMLNQRAKTEMTNAFDLVVDARYLGQMMSGFEKKYFLNGMPNLRICLIIHPK